MAIAAIAGVASAGTNLVTDGTFDPSINGYTEIDAGSTFDGWLVGNGTNDAGGGGSVDFIGNYWQGALGGGSVDLDGLAPGSISQTINTVSGQLYDLSFYLSGNPDNSGFTGHTANVDLNLSNVMNLSFTTPAPSQSHSQMDYVLENVTFTATGPTTDLSFISTDATDSPYGAVISGVSVTAVPEPATWAMLLLGVGGIGAAMRMSKRREGATLATA